MMKLVSHAPVDAAADQVEWTFLREKYLTEIRFTFDISRALTNLLRENSFQLLLRVEDTAEIKQ